MRKKGFTLIELLAVIVVLAVIALIAVPIVLNIIEQSRKGAATVSARSYIKAVETYIVSSELDKEKESLEAGKTYLTSELDDKVELKGTKPESGNVTISNQNSVANATLVINGYTINYNGLDESYTINNGNTSSNDNCIGSGLENIVLNQKSEILGDTKNANDYVKTFVDNVLSKWKEEAKEETLISIKEATYTWESSDESIASISDGLISFKKEGTITITGTSDKGNKIKIPILVATGYLANEAQVGDYVAYDAGAWTNSASLPTGQGGFGGYTAGNNKANSVSVCNSSSSYGSTSLKGWRVLSIDKNTNTVTIIHAGQPECYYHYNNSSNSVTNLNNRATSQYLNDTYANSAHMMNKDEADVIATSNNLRAIGSAYYLASLYTSTSLRFGNSVGGIGSRNNESLGVRPVVVLKPNIKTTGKTTDAVGQEAWSLVPDTSS